MKRAKRTGTLNLGTETLRALGVDDLREAAGGGIHGTGTPTGLCPTNTQTCPKTL